MDAVCRTGLLLCGLVCVGCSGPSNASDGEAESAASESESESSTTDGSDTGETTDPMVSLEVPWETAVDPCDDVTCSGHGTCIAESGLATCVCEPGFLAHRHECIACSPLAEDHVYDVDVAMITVAPQITAA